MISVLLHVCLAAATAGPASIPSSPPQKPLCAWVADQRVKFNRAPLERIIHLAILSVTTKNAIESVRTDEWSAIRLRPPEPGEGTRGIRAAIAKRRRRASKVGALLGAGYTPRMTFLAGLMLRSLQMGTALCRFFDPSLGYAAGGAIAAAFARREWLMCILLGWGVGGGYWAAFRVRPP